MKVKAKCWVNHNGIWQEPGTVFEADAGVAETLKDLAEVVEAPQVPAPEEKSEKKKRTRKASE